MVEQGYDVGPSEAPLHLPAPVGPAEAFRQARIMQEQLRRRRN